MKAKERRVLIERLTRKIDKLPKYVGFPDREAERMFRVISAVSHAQIPGEQRRTKAGRAFMDELVRQNVGVAVNAL